MGEVSWEVRESEGVVGLTRCAIALRIAVVSGLAMLVVLPANAFGASVAEIATNGGAQPFVRVNGDGADNEITVTLSGGNYTVSDTTGVTAGTGCTQAGADVTCPATGITWTVLNGGGGGDTLNGSSGRDRINGGPGADELNGNEGDDIFNTGRGGIDIDPGSLTYCGDVPPFRCADDTNIAGGPATQGWDLLTYADRTGSITTDLRPGRTFARDDDGTVDGVNGIEGVVGGLASDELIGGLGPDYFNGGPGNAPDTMCGGLGKDTVDYSDKSAGVTVTLDGVLATDPDINDSDPNISVGARQDCRLTIKAGGTVQNGQPCQPNSYIQFASCRKDPTGPAPGEPELRRDCTPNDGVQGENDCVGEDIENIVGSPSDDVLIGNDVDSLYGLGPRVEPAGENVIDGGGGDDLLDGGLGADVFKGGGGFDAVSYEGRNEPIAASLDGAANDGSAARQERRQQPERPDHGRRRGSDRRKRRRRTEGRRRRQHRAWWSGQ